MPSDHTDIMVNGNVYPDGRRTNMILSERILCMCRWNVEDCIQYAFCITWDATTHTMTLKQGVDTLLSYSEDFVNTIFGGNSNVYWGFVGSTGVMRTTMGLS